MVVLLTEMKINGVRGKYIIIIIPTQHSNANLVQYASAATALGVVGRCDCAG